MTKQPKKQDVNKLIFELKHISARVALRMFLREQQDPEDYVLLRGSTEELIKLAENAPVRRT